jgi:hypothetical protein
MDIPNETIEYSLKQCVETGLLIHFSELNIIFNKHNDQKGGGIFWAKRRFVKIQVAFQASYPSIVFFV